MVDWWLLGVILRRGVEGGVMGLERGGLFFVVDGGGGGWYFVIRGRRWRLE